MEEKKTPGQLEDEAVEASKKGEWERAADLFQAAAGACTGFNRASFYEQMADQCRYKHREAQKAK
jgi:hypothetical protein